MTPREMLSGFERVAVALEMFLESHPVAWDEGVRERVQVVMSKCQHILARRSAECDWKAMAALANQTLIGCKYLRELSSIPLQAEVLRSVACNHPDWPVALSPQHNSLTEAKEYLRSLNVGTASYPPTASIHAAGEMRYRNFATALIQKIESFRDLLSYIPESASWQASRLENLPEAKNWEALVLPLPSREKKKEVCDEWWMVAKQMMDLTLLIDREIELKAQNEGKSPRAYATRQVKRAFYKLFTS